MSSPPASSPAGVTLAVSGNSLVRFFEARGTSNVFKLGKLVEKIDAEHVGVKVKYFKLERAEGASSCCSVVSAAGQPCFSCHVSQQLRFSCAVTV